jgi:hypothetical protein
MIRSLSAPLRSPVTMLGSRSMSRVAAAARPSLSSTLSPMTAVASRRALSSTPSKLMPDYRTPDPNRSTYQSRYDKLQLLLFRVVDEKPHNPEFDSEGNRVQHSKRAWRTLIAGIISICVITYGITRPADTPFLDQDKWWNFPIEWMEVVSGTLKDGQHKVLTVRMPDDHRPVKGNPEAGAEGIFHVLVKDPNLNIERVSPVGAHLAASARRSMPHSCPR